MALATRNLQLAYVAGFVDGEGCIGIYANGSYLRLSVQIGQRDNGVLEYIQSVLGGTLTSTKWRNGTGKTLAWYNFEAGRMLQEIIPYLVLKRRQAELCVEFLRLAPGMGRRCTPEVAEQRLAIATEVKTLKVVA